MYRSKDNDRFKDTFNGSVRDTPRDTSKDRPNDRPSGKPRSRPVIRRNSVAIPAEPPHYISTLHSAISR